MHRVRLGVTLRYYPRLTQAFPVDEWLGAPMISHTGSTILIRNPSLRELLVWGVATGRRRPPPEVKLPTIPGRIELSCDGTVAVFLPFDGPAAAWDTTTGKPVSLPMAPGRASRLSDPLSPDGSRWLRPPFRRQEEAGQLRAANGEQIGSLLAHDTRVTTTALSRDGKLAATGDSSGYVKLWDASTGLQVGQLLEHGWDVVALQFSVDGTKLASVGNDGTCQVWEVGTGKKLGARLSTGGGLWPSVAFSWDGARIVLAGEYYARVWFVETGRAASGPILHGYERVQVWFAENDRVLGIHGPDGPVRLWDSATGRPITPKPGRYGRSIASDVSRPRTSPPSAALPSWTGARRAASR